MGHHPNSRLKVRPSLTRHLTNIATIPKGASSGRYECTKIWDLKNEYISESWHKRDNPELSLRNPFL